jgi:hypothetical protein
VALIFIKRSIVPLIEMLTIKKEIMENIYTAYSRDINGKTFFFVKKYNIFPEYADFPKVLDSMGMHTDFYKACEIAKITDEVIIKRLLNELHILPDSTKVIQMHGVKAMTHTILRNTQQAISKLRLAGIN